MKLSVWGVFKIVARKPEAAIPKSNKEDIPLAIKKVHGFEGSKVQPTDNKDLLLEAHARNLSSPENLERLV